MAFFDSFKSIESIFPDQDKYLRDSMPKTRTVEKIVKKVSPEAGKVVEKINNTLDTIENGAKSLEKDVIITKVIGRITGLDKVLQGDIDEVKKKLQKGDHIKVQRIGYSHHGIYDGYNSVYEYDEGVVKCVSLKEFALNDNIEVVINEPSKFTKDEIVRRAQRRLGESDYNLICNNCENFATWCRIGEE